VRENRTHGSIGGRWGGNAHGETETAPVWGNPPDRARPTYKRHRTSGLPHHTSEWGAPRITQDRAIDGWLMAHNPKVVGSNPTPATNYLSGFRAPLCIGATP
jgi:hypothetical protein